MAEETAIGKWKQFLETKPPNTSVQIPGLLALGKLAMALERYPDVTLNFFSPGQIDLHCEKDGGSRTFHTGPKIYLKESRTYQFITYTCRNCQKTTKTFAVLFERKEQGDVEVMKLGEFPPFSTPISPQIPRLLTDQADLELYRRGVRAIAQGLGIGAASYFRRIVESKWKDLARTLRDAAEQLGEDVSVFNEALDKTQFSDAVDMLKDAIPDKLLLPDRQNPLTLLHRALSQQLHELTDEACLQHAQDIRLILTALLENIANVLKKQNEVRDAANRLAQRRASS